MEPIQTVILDLTDETVSDFLARNDNPDSPNFIIDDNSGTYKIIITFYENITKKPYPTKNQRK